MRSGAQRVCVRVGVSACAPVGGGEGVCPVEGRARAREALVRRRSVCCVGWSGMVGPVLAFKGVLVAAVVVTRPSSRPS